MSEIANAFPRPSAKLRSWGCADRPRQRLLGLRCTSSGQNLRVQRDAHALSQVPCKTGQTNFRGELKSGDACQLAIASASHSSDLFASKFGSAPDVQRCSEAGRSEDSSATTQSAKSSLAPPAVARIQAANETGSRTYEQGKHWQRAALSLVCVAFSLSLECYVAPNSQTTIYAARTQTGISLYSGVFDRSENSSEGINTVASGK